MKKNRLLIIFIISCIVAISFTTTLDYFYQPKAVEEVVVDSLVFVPDVDLMNEEMWTRVSEFRFENQFLRLAVEWRDGEYLLLEMDGENRVLARSPMYSVISQKITELTIKF